MMIKGDLPNWNYCWTGIPSKSFSTYHSWFSRSGIPQ